MLKLENYTSEHIDTLRKQTGADPSILERTVFAFGFSECNLNVIVNVIVNVIGVFYGFSKFSQIDRNH